MGQKLANTNNVMMMMDITDSEKKLDIYSKAHTIYISLLSLKKWLVQIYKMQLYFMNF